MEPVSISAAVSAALSEVVAAVKTIADVLSMISKPPDAQHTIMHNKNQSKNR